MQACSDGVRFLDERRAGMIGLLDRSVRDAVLQLKVSALNMLLQYIPCQP